jgi:predicted RNA-binding protein with EMAP domain
MICAFCGERFSGKPIKQDRLVYCSIECADMAAEVVSEDEEYYEEDDLDMGGYDEEEE